MATSPRSASDLSTDGENAIRQPTTDTADAAQKLTVTLGDFAAQDNATYGALADDSGTKTITAGSTLET